MMGVARPGSARWLVQHELRLAWRGSRERHLSLFVILGGLWVALHAGIYLTFSWLLSSDGMPGWIPPALGGATWALVGVLVAGANSASVLALFNRGDLDLLLSSPLPSRTVFFARGLGIAADAAKTLLFLLTPVAHVGLLFGYWKLLAIYLAVPALALAVTGLGMALCMTLVRLLGARRTRSMGQVLGTLLGAGVFAAVQLNPLRHADGVDVVAAMATRLQTSGDVFASDSYFWLPAQALGGAPLQLLALMVIGPTIFWLVILLAHRRFLAGTQEAVAGSTSRAGNAQASVTARFSSGLVRTIVRKEWRLIRRDPQLLSQTLTNLVYVCIPMVVVALGQGMDKAGLLTLLGPAIVFWAASLTSNLAWITVAADEAPDLLQAAPVPAQRIRQAKALAALAPVWCLTIPALAWVTSGNLKLLPALLLCLFGATISEAAGHVWYPTRARRTEMARRFLARGAVGPIAGIVALAWAVAGLSLNAALMQAPWALLVVVLGLAAIWILGRARRT